MNQIRISPSVTALLVLAIAFVPGAFGQESFVPGDLIVFVQSEDQQSRVEEFAQANQAKTYRLLNKRIFKISLPPTKDLNETKDRLMNLPWVRVVDKNWIVKGVLSVVPNDPAVQPPEPLDQWHHSAIRSYEAWDIVNSYPGKIAVMDTGIHFDDVPPPRVYHPDLSANVELGSGRSFVPNDDPFDEDDMDGHGTMVSGLLAGVGNNGIGVPGVVWSTKLVPIKIWGLFDGTPLENLLNAIEYAISTGAKIINNSWNLTNHYPSFVTAISDAAAQDVLFVFSAGNGRDPDPNIKELRAGEDIDSTGFGFPHTVVPCKYQLDNVICVAAVDQNRVVGGSGVPPDPVKFSNWGKNSVDLSAPGLYMYSTRIPRGSGQLYGDDGRPHGTSWAAPQVSGTLALMKQLNPTYDYRQLKDALLLSVSPESGLYDKTISGGVLDVRNAIRAFGDRFDDSWNGNYFFSAIVPPASTSARWSVISGSCCNLSVGVLPYTYPLPCQDCPEGSDYVAVAHFSGSTYWTAAGHETTYPPGKDDQNLTLNIADPGGIGFSGKQGRVGVGLVVQSGLTTQTCPTTSLSFQQMTIGNSVIGGIDLVTRRPFVFFDPPYTEQTPADGQSHEVPVDKLIDVPMLSIHLETRSDCVQVSITDSRTGDEILPPVQFNKPGNWSWVSGTWKSSFLYYSPTQSGTDSIYVRSFVSTR